MDGEGTGERQPGAGLPLLADLQHWTGVLGRAQQMIMEAGAAMLAQSPPTTPVPQMPAMFPLLDPGAMLRAQTEMWGDFTQLWQSFSTPPGDPAPAHPARAAADQDRRFSAPAWRENVLFDVIRQTYLMASDHLLRHVDAIVGIDDKQRDQLRFAARTFTDAVSPSNFPLTNPLVLTKAIESRGESLLTGLERILSDLGKGQLTHSDREAFELGRNLAVTPGKVIKRTPLYELIQYEPATKSVLAVPLIIFPPWINRFYILDLTPKKSFIRWAVEQGLTVFMVSWKSADADLAETTWDDYVAAQIDAIDTVRDLLSVERVHTLGYCVAGTTLAATLALLAARGEADKVCSATFLTAQVDFSEAGDLKLFVDEAQMALLGQLSASSGFLDGRYMAAAFNLLRGRDLIWNYVVNNYLLGEDYAPFDLLHWNGDVTNLPAKWHLSYLQDLYHANKLVEPGAMSVAGIPIDLGTVKTASYVQAGREDHIAPPESVWKITGHFTGPLRFVLAGSGHIAGVINPPDANKYQYWINDNPAPDLAAFVAGAREIAGSWWPDWARWLSEQSSERVPVKGARKPGRGKLKPIDAAPGLYVRQR